MSFKRTVKTTVPLTPANGDMSQPVVSAVTPIEYLSNICYQLTWTGNPSGQFFVDGSMDGVNFGTLPFSITPAAGTPGTNLLDLNQVSFFFVRVRYVPSSGAGNLVVILGAKSS